MAERSSTLMQGYGAPPVIYGAPPPETDAYAPEPQYPYAGPPAPGTGFTLQQAQWLIQFMVNLPGGAPAEPTEDEYTQAMNAQRDSVPPMYSPYPSEGYGQPPWDNEEPNY